MCKNIVLMGIKHCGKSTLGKMLAFELKKKFFDIDKLIENKYPEGSLTVREIRKKENESGFRLLEKEAISHNIDEMVNSVISLGGGTIENDDALEFIVQNSIFVYLKEAPDILFKRIRENGMPSFLNDGKPYENFMKLFIRRSALYEKRADITVELDGFEIDMAYGKLKEKLKEAGYAG